MLSFEEVQCNWLYMLSFRKLFTTNGHLVNDKWKFELLLIRKTKPKITTGNIVDCVCTPDRYVAMGRNSSIAGQIKSFN